MDKEWGKDDFQAVSTKLSRYVQPRHTPFTSFQGRGVRNMGSDVVGDILRATGSGIYITACSLQLAACSYVRWDWF